MLQTCYYYYYYYYYYHYYYYYYLRRVPQGTHCLGNSNLYFQIFFFLFESHQPLLVYLTLPVFLFFLLRTPLKKSVVGFSHILYIELKFKSIWNLVNE